MDVCSTPSASLARWWRSKKRERPDDFEPNEGTKRRQPPSGRHPATLVRYLIEEEPGAREHLASRVAALRSEISAATARASFIGYDGDDGDDRGDDHDVNELKFSLGLFLEALSGGDHAALAEAADLLESASCNRSVGRGGSGSGGAVSVGSGSNNQWRSEALRVGRLRDAAAVRASALLLSAEEARRREAQESSSSSSSSSHLGHVAVPRDVPRMTSVRDVPRMGAEEGLVLAAGGGGRSSWYSAVHAVPGVPLVITGGACFITGLCHCAEEGCRFKAAANNAPSREADAVDEGPCRGAGGGPAAGSSWSGSPWSGLRALARALRGEGSAANSGGALKVATVCGSGAATTWAGLEDWTAEVPAASTGGSRPSVCGGNGGGGGGGGDLEAFVLGVASGEEACRSRPRWATTKKRGAFFPRPRAPRLRDSP